MTINGIIEEAFRASHVPTDDEMYIGCHCPTLFRAALAASGYAVVPVEATEEMKKAAEGAIDQLEWSMHFRDGEVNIDMSNLGAFWNAMIDAAQKEGEE